MGLLNYLLQQISKSIKQNHMKKAEIEYPCSWPYRIIGQDDQAMRAAAELIIGNKEYKIDISRSSRGGKYISLVVETVVADEQERLRIYNGFCEHADIKMVL